MSRLRKGDQVIVTSGADKGQLRPDDLLLVDRVLVQPERAASVVVQHQRRRHRQRQHRDRDQDLGEAEAGFASNIASIR